MIATRGTTRERHATKPLLQAGIAAVLGLFALQAHGHFLLASPASWIEQDEQGDPQKMAPCGGTVADGGTRTGAVTDVTGGAMLRLAIDETVYHPGHYRVALARRINLLPSDPPAVLKQTENGTRSDHAPIDANPQPPVLLDGLWQNQQRRTGPLETEIRIPNIDCEGCFLQVIQFMENHPGVREGGYSYHHCAVLNITADASQPLEEGW
ncbi:MAG TPA: SCE4755 family polysaccharide monooxygenase-like protein [Hyphomicrobiales bacterium]|nr:SCE4755 family polysaccharide monooxygenase-like protein [Hyphomicrobiales bacterium]